MDQQDFSIYTKLYELLFSTSPNQTTEIPVVEKQDDDDDDMNAPPPIVPITNQEKEEEVLLFTPIPQPVE